METVGILAGTTIGISATLPSTFDDDGSTGYPAQTYSTLGEIVDWTPGGKVWNSETSNPINQRSTEYYKSTNQFNADSFTLNRDDDDAGQVIALAALDSDSDYAFEVSYPDGSEDYFTGKVMEFLVAAGAASNLVRRNMSVQRTRDTVTVAAA